MDLESTCATSVHRVSARPRVKRVLKYTLQCHDSITFHLRFCYMHASLLFMGPSVPGTVTCVIGM